MESFVTWRVWQDKVTRRIIGWSVAETMTQELVISALQKAIIKGLVKAGAIIHSDRGSQYAANNFRLLLQTSCFRYWGQGVWTDYAREIYQRGEKLS